MKYHLEFEVGQFFTGNAYSKVTTHEERFSKNEWTVFIQTKNTYMRRYISQFIDFVDFQIPLYDKVDRIKPPEESQSLRNVPNY